MAKKDFSHSISGIDSFFSAAAPTQPEQPEPMKPAKAVEAPAPVEEPAVPAKHGRETYIFTLHLPKAWKEILADTAWERRQSVTGLLVEIIGDWLKAHKKI